MAMTSHFTVRWGRWLSACAILAVSVSAMASMPAASADPGGQGQNQAVDKAAEQQAALVVAEDKRLNQIRAVAAVAGLQWAAKKPPITKAKAPLPTNPWKQSFRINTGSGYTLILMQQPNPYTLADLLRLAPQTFVRQPDGSYLLTENLYLNNGAQLDLSNPGLIIRMASSVKGFVSIVSFGGVLTLGGTEKAPATITSWDPRTGQPDTDVSDGRAYIRAIGGRLLLAYTTLSHLGFWSGRTGGLSLTGTDRPNKGSITNDPNANPPAGSTNVTTQPPGPITKPSNQFSVPGLSYVSGQISHSTITGDAFGFFASSANGISITDTTIEHSLVDGVVMHRFVTNAHIDHVTSRDNGNDGFVLARATQQVQVTNSTADHNGRNGLTLSGQPLAKGASASGESTANYGSNSVSDCVITANGRYGIDMVGGLHITVQNNRVEGGDMGIVARRGVDTVTIAKNTLRGQRRQGISLRDGVIGGKITNNTVQGVDSSIYMRDSIAAVTDNKVQDSTNHGISLVGNVTGSVVTNNVVDGIGPSAVDTQRAHGDFISKDNDTTRWFDTRSFWAQFRHYASPMTLLWATIVLLILFSALKRSNRRRRRAAVGRNAILHPYADKVPLAARVSREIIAPHMPVLARVPAARASEDRTVSTIGDTQYLPVVVE
jgi:parallel beta-helix repeat protein